MFIFQTNIDMFREELRVVVDKKQGKAAQKRWAWVKKGAPVIVEIGNRDAQNGEVTMLRRDRLYKDDGKLDSQSLARDEFVQSASGLIADIQQALFDQANGRMQSQVRNDIHDIQSLADHFNGKKYPGWVSVVWSRPTGEALEQVVKTLKAMKLTIRNTPEEGEPVKGPCFFTGEPAVERVLIARAY